MKLEITVSIRGDGYSDPSLAHYECELKQPAISPDFVRLLSTLAGEDVAKQMESGPKIEAPGTDVPAAGDVL